MLAGRGMNPSMRRQWLKKRSGCRTMAGQVRVILEGAEGVQRSVTAIYDVGSPVSMVKQSAVRAAEVQPDTGAQFSWGTAAPVGVIGSADMTLRWTRNSAVDATFKVVPDNQLPRGVDALLGNDVIWALPCCVRAEATCKGKTIHFDHDPEPVVLETFHASNGAISHVGCATDDAFEVVVGEGIMVPPRSRVNIMGLVKGAGLVGDAEALFIPKARQDALNVWTAQFNISSTNRAPWVLVGLLNLTPHAIHLRRGEQLGHAHLACDVVNLVQSREGFVDQWDADDKPSVQFAHTEPAVETPVLVDVRVEPEMSAAFKASEKDYEFVAGEDDWESLWAATEGNQLFRDVQVGGGETESPKAAMFHGAPARTVDEEEEKARADFAKMRDSLRARLNTDQMRVVDQLLSRHEQFFCRVNVARADSEEYPFYLRIPTLAQRPVSVPPYHYPPDKLKALHDWALRQVDKAHIEPTTSAWNAPMVLTRKKDGRWRFAIDLRGLNEVALFDPYVLPRIHDLVELTEGCSWFSAMDLADGFWNCLVHPEDRHKLAFTVPGLGRFQWRSVPFGLHASAPHFQRAMEAMLAGLSWQETAVYVDDVLVYTKDFDSHVHALDAVLSRLAQGGFVAAPAKCRLFEREVPYLGYRLSAKGIAMDPDYLARVRSKMVQFRNKDDIRAFMGAVQFYSRFVWACAERLAPLADALKKEVKDDLSNLSADERGALGAAAAAVILAMESGPVLALPNFDKEFVLTTDASNVALGAALCQEADDGTLRPICLWSRKLTPTERNYSATEREALAIVYFVDKFKYYLLGRRFLLRTDHRALVHILRGAANNSKLARWALRLQEFNFDVAYLKGRENVLADAMSRMLVDSSPVEEWNAGERGQYLRWRWSGADEEVIVPARPVVLPVAVEENPVLVVRGGEEGREAIVLDSPLLDHPKIDLVALQRADAEAQVLRQLLDAQLTIDAVPGDYSSAWKAQVRAALQDGRLTSRNGLVAYLSDELGAAGELEPKRLRAFVPQVLRRALLYDKHDAPWAAHLGFKKTKQRVAARYWWPMMARDIDEWTSTCEDCQRADKGYQRRYGSLHPLPPVLRPFERMGVDLVKIVSKKAQAASGDRYAMVVTDYGTRFAIIVALPDKTAKTVASALWHRVIAFTGPPSELVTDNGGEFRGVVRELTERFGVHRTWTTPYHPRTNGLTERFNRTLVDMLCTVSEGGKYIERWTEYLPMLQFAYNSAWQASVGECPYYLMFGRRPATPLDIAIGDAGLTDRDSWKTMLDDARDAAVAALSQAQEAQRRTYNRKRQEPQIAVGDVVWLREGRVPKEFNRKTFAPLGGPYRVTQVHGVEGAVVDVEHLTNPIGQRRVNVERLLKSNRREVPDLSLAERQAAAIETGKGKEEAGDEAGDEAEAEGEAPDAVEVEPDLGERLMSQLSGEGGKGPGDQVGAAVPTLVPADAMVEVPLSPLPAQQDGQVFDIRRIWAHRAHPDFPRRRQYLVEWEIATGRRLGTWVDAKDLAAKQALDWYWTSLREHSLPEWVEPRQQNACQYYGYDSGCEHLACRYPSWKLAMEEIGYETLGPQTVRKPEVSGGSDVGPRGHRTRASARKRK
jgi:transposase InsO family protein